MLLEAVAEDIREYLRSRRDTIRCIVTMLTDDSAGTNSEAEGESLFEELKRTVADEVHCPSNPMPHFLCIFISLRQAITRLSCPYTPVMYIIFCLSACVKVRPPYVVAG